MSNNIVTMLNVSKIYSNGVIANDNVSLDITRGDIHAIAGENGAGKSTLMKMLYGLETPSSGKIIFDGEDVNISSPKVANKLGIGMVHQHFMLVEQLDVIDNFILGSEDTKAGFIKRKDAHNKLQLLCQEYDMPIDANAIVSDLSIVQKQKLEILKALSKNTKMLILDEPTAVLTPQETQELFRQLLLLNAKGYTIIIITHKLKEIKQICNKISILRNGKFMGTYDVSDVSEEDISRLMVGRDVVRSVDKSAPTIGDIIIEANAVTKYSNGRAVLNDITMSCCKGEIVCLAGVEGNGQRELVKILTGQDHTYEGELIFEGQSIKTMSIAQLRRNGQCHIPEDRIRDGINTNASISDNLISTRLGEISHCGMLDRKRMQHLVSNNISSYKIKCDNSSQKVAMLSGGNMQKVVVARETDKAPILLIADQPTRGVDVGAIEFIHSKIVELRDNGCAIILVSCDLSEVFALSDRILVFHCGEIVANIREVKALSEEQLGRYMLGIERTEKVINE